MIGYIVEQELGNLLPIERPLATLLTMVEVDPEDPAFGDPTKFVGPIYDEATATALAAEKGWHVKPDGPSWRRVVPSPRPQADLRDPADALDARARARSSSAPAAGASRPCTPRAWSASSSGWRRSSTRTSPAACWRASSGRICTSWRPTSTASIAIGAADPGPDRPGDSGRARRDGPAGGFDGAEGRRRGRVRARPASGRRSDRSTTSTRWSTEAAGHRSWRDRNG